MKFSIKREDIIPILTEFTNILKENPIKPIISGLQIKAEKGMIILVGTNLDIDLVRQLPAEVIEEGSVILKPALLLEYIKLLEEEELMFTLNDGYLTVHQAEFSILQEESFPSIVPTSPVVLLNLQGGELVKMLDKAKFAASLSNDNIQINCVRMIFKQDELNLVSTDSYRLLYLKADTKCFVEKEISVPLETVNILCKLLKDYEKEITIGFSEEFLIVTWENAYFSSKTISMPFPDFRMILNNASFDKVMEFNRDELKSALKRVITVAKTSVDAKYGAIFTFKGKIALLNAFSGRAKINQKVNMIKDGEDFKASLNCKFIVDYIDNISKNPIIKGTNASSMFEITEEGDQNYRYILMPLALR